MCRVQHTEDYHNTNTTVEKKKKKIWAVNKHQMPSTVICRVQPNTKTALKNPKNTLAEQTENTHIDIHTQTIM